MRAAFAALLLVAGCHTPTQQDGPQGWPRHVLATGTEGAPGYSVAMPPDLERRFVQGIDSQVAEFARPGLSISFDYGWYGGFAECDDRPLCRQWEERIGGRTWRLSSTPPDILVGRPLRRFLSAHVRLGERMSLAVGAACESDAHCERALGIVRTIEFGDDPAAGPSRLPAAPAALRSEQRGRR